MSTHNSELLNNKDVVDEINRHRWLESEKAGQDIGFESAAADWLKRFSKAWMQYHMPEKVKEHPAQSNRSSIMKTRRARSYLAH